MERIVVCFFDMGRCEQTVQLVTSIGGKTICHSNIYDLPWILVKVYEEYDAAKIHLYGCDLYIRTIVDEIKEINNNIEIGVN